ncbi:MAG: hypothetical protein J1E85_03330 [Ruminococcus sp.]|nr:hypothetical protein [Ruminococcus sp.]
MMNVKLMKFDINNIIKAENECIKHKIKKLRLNLFYRLFLLIICLSLLFVTPFLVDDILQKRNFYQEIMGQFIFTVCYIVVLCAGFYNLWNTIKIFRQIYILNKDSELLNSSDSRKVCDIIFKSENQKNKSDILFNILYNSDKILSLKFFNSDKPNLEMEYVDEAHIVHKELINIYTKIIRTDISDIIIDLYNEVVFYPYDSEFPSVVSFQVQFSSENQNSIITDKTDTEVQKTRKYLTGEEFTEKEFLER